MLSRAEGSRSGARQGTVELGIEWKDVMAFRVHSDRVVIIDGPVGYKGTHTLPGAQEVE